MPQFLRRIRLETRDHHPPQWNQSAFPRTETWKWREPLAYCFVFQIHVTVAITITCLCFLLYNCFYDLNKLLERPYEKTLVKGLYVYGLVGYGKEWVDGWMDGWMDTDHLGMLYTYILNWHGSYPRLKLFTKPVHELKPHHQTNCMRRPHDTESCRNYLHAKCYTYKCTGLLGPKGNMPHISNESLPQHCWVLLLLEDTCFAIDSHAIAE